MERVGTRGDMEEQLVTGQGTSNRPLIRSSAPISAQATLLDAPRDLAHWQAQRGLLNVEGALYHVAQHLPARLLDGVLPWQGLGLEARGPAQPQR